MTAHRHRNRTVRRHCAVVFVVITLFASTQAGARVFDNIRLSKIGQETTVEIELQCAMRYAGHSSTDGGLKLVVQLSLGLDCPTVLRGTPTELRRPVGARMADLSVIEFNAGARDQATIILHFLAPLAYEVQQSANAYMLTVVVDSSSESSVDTHAPTVTQTAPPTPQSPDTIPPRPLRTDREPARQVRSSPMAAENLFIVRVGVLSKLTDANYAALTPFRSQIVYTNEIIVGDRRWTELRLGFFDTETKAQQALARLGPSFESAWITVANKQEQADAQTQLFNWSDAKARAAEPRATIAAVNPTAKTIPEQRATAMMDEARTALLRRDFRTSIAIYTDLLTAPGGTHRRKAREFLGVALQKNGQTTQAIAEYSAYLDEFAQGPDARRVQQRLAALSVPQQSVAVPSAGSTAVGSAAWEIYGGASQYYLRGVNLAEDNEPKFIAQSALLSQAQIIARYRGRRFDIVGRGNMSYLYDFVEDGVEDQALVSQAYIEVTDTNTEFNARVGRQTRYRGGVPGRFDGAHASYRILPNLAVNVTTGFPIDSPRFLADPDHYFYGASIDLDNVGGAWDFSLFGNLQTVDGISDRKAVGAETQYHSRRLNLVGLLDYDASYNVINTALASANWHIGNRLTLYGRLRGGVAPFMTTRNAIIGQGVNTVQELFATYTEGQIRRLARNRTSNERAASTGLTAALTPRLQFKVDVTYLEIDGSVASGGVAMFPETGPQYSYGGHLLGSGFIKAGHVFVVGYRHDETRSVDADTFWFDMRYPIGERMRIQSRLNISRRIRNQNPAGDIDHWIADPVFRVLYTWRRKYRLELEFGGRWSNREYPLALAPPLTPGNVEESSSYYLQLGYTLDF